jgi:RimJ/RimL family protein N-acetyltransferase
MNNDIRAMENLNIELRLPLVSDLDFILEVENDKENERYTTLSKPSPEDVLAFLNSGQDYKLNGQLRLIITVNKISAGIIDIFNASPSGRKAETGIIIIPGFRKKGVAKMAYKLFFLVCKHLNILEIEAIVNRDNFQANLLFTALGFALEKKANSQIHYLKRL